MSALPTNLPVRRTKGLQLLPGGVIGGPARLPGAGAGMDAPRVGLLDADRDFADAVPEHEHRLARMALQLPRLGLEPGRWEGPPPQRDHAAPATMLVLEGLVSQSTWLQGRTSVELHGPGDVIDCSAYGAEGEVTWSVHQPTCLAHLDDRFALAAARWPRLWHVLLHRTSMRAGRLAAQLAALQLSRIDDRLEAVLWQLADRWGRVTPDGVVVPLTLTHEMLGQLTAAKRPTVSVALTALAERGSVTRRADGSWLLVAGA